MGIFGTYFQQCSNTLSYINQPTRAGQLIYTRSAQSQIVLNRTYQLPNFNLIQHYMGLPPAVHSMWYLKQNAIAIPVVMKWVTPKWSYNFLSYRKLIMDNKMSCAHPTPFLDKLFTHHKNSISGLSCPKKQLVQCKWYLERKITIHYNEG